MNPYSYAISLRIEHRPRTRGELESRSAEATLAVALARLARDLGRHGELFRRLRGEGGRAELFIGWFLEGNTGDELPELLSELGSLGLDLSLDVYPPNPGSGEGRATRD